MSSLISGAAGSSWSRSSGLAAGSVIANSDVEATALQVRPQSLGPNVGQFRRALIDTTVDGTGAPLSGVSVDVFRTANDVKVYETVSDAGGMYEAYVYEDGPFYAVAYKAGAPDVTGATVNTLRGA